MPGRIGAFVADKAFGEAITVAGEVEEVEAAIPHAALPGLAGAVVANVACGCALAITRKTALGVAAITCAVLPCGAAVVADKTLGLFGQGLASAQKPGGGAFAVVALFAWGVVAHMAFGAVSCPVLAAAWGAGLVVVAHAVLSRWAGTVVADAARGHVFTGAYPSPPGYGFTYIALTT